MVLKGPKMAKKNARKGLRKVKKYHETVKKVKILPSEATEKWLKMSEINVKGPTVQGVILEKPILGCNAVSSKYLL